MKHFTFILLLVLLGSCRNKPAEEKQQKITLTEYTVTLTPAQYRNAGLAFGMLQSRPVASILRLNGLIEVPPQNLVSVSVPMGGYLKSTSLLPGMTVRKRQVLALVEDQQYIQMQQDYLTARARIQYLKNDYERQRELNQSKASSDKATDLALSEYRTQIVLLRSLEEKLQLAGIQTASLTESTISRTITVRSPISGFVSKVNVNRGKYLVPSDVLFEIVNLSDMHLTLRVFEKDLSKIYKGQKLWAYTNNNPQRRYACTVSLIAKDLSPDRSAEVHCHFEQTDAQLVPGTYMNADVEIAGKNAMVLPEEAVVRFEGKDYVFVQKADRMFEMIEVATGVQENDWIEIAVPQALQGKKIVIKGAYTLLMALKNTPDE